MKKVLMLSTDAQVFRPSSEARRRMEEYGQLFDELHIVVTVADQSGPGTEKVSEKLFLHRALARTRIGAFGAAYGAAEKILKSGGDWVITAQDPFENGLNAYWLSNQFRIPFQLQVHTDFLSPYFSGESLKNRVRVWIARKILPKAEGVRVVSERIKRSLIAEGLVEAAKITVLPIFTDFALLKKAKANDLRAQHPSHNLFILMASRLTEEKHISLALEAMAMVIEKFPKAMLVIVGSGPEKAVLEAEVARRGLAANVAFKPYSDDLAGYYRASDLFLLTSNYEGYGRVAVEAAVAGLPVVMTDVGVALGMVVPVGDATATAVALERLAADKAGRAAIVSAQNEFLKTLHASKDAYLKAYAASLQLRRPRRLLMITQKMDLDDDVLGVYHRWAEGLATQFDSVSVICLYKGRVSVPGNVAVYSLGKETGQSRLKYIFNFYKYVWALRNQYDTVFVHMNLEYLLLAGWLWKLLGKKIVFWYAHYLGTFKLKIAALFPDKIVTSVRMAYPFESKKLAVLQQGIDTDRFAPEKIKEKSPALRVLFLGRIAPVKHVDVLIRAIQETDGASLTIVGGPTSGKPVEAAYYDSLKVLVAELGLADRVTFQPPVPNDEAPAVYNRHDLFVNLTDTGSFDKSTLEAMACGLPVLVSNKAFLDIFPEDLAGISMFPEQDAGALAAKVRDIARMTVKERAALGAKMRTLIVERHGLKTLIDRLAAALR